MTLHLLAFGVAGLAALAILGIGGFYVARPSLAMRSFGLPPPEAAPTV